MKTKKDILSILTIILLCVTSIAGILSMDFTKAYNFVNQYGHSVMLYGSGLYAHDSYFKAPINIGNDFCTLFVIVPLFIYYYRNNQKLNNKSTKLKLISVYSFSLYIAASYAFGVTYNSCFLIYLGLFACSLFGMFYHIVSIQNKDTVTMTTGLKLFLVISGIALIVAWLPDIIPTLINGTTLPLIGVYTTEITYILDMGIISPLCFLCIYLLQKKKPLGTVVLAILLKSCILIGIVVIAQTVLQVLSNADITLIALLTKAASFLVLSFFAYYFERRLYRQLGETLNSDTKKHPILCTIGMLIVLLILYWKMPYSLFHQKFHDEMLERSAQTQNSDEVCTGDEIRRLPEPLQRYCNYINLEGFQKHNTTHVVFEDTDFVFDSSSGKQLNMDYDLWLFNDEIKRGAYCTSSMLGIPFDGIDYSTEDLQGGMKGMLGKAFTIFDECTEQGYQAGIISWFAESVAMNPSVLFSPYVTYETIDDNHVKATVDYNGVSGSGIFTINDEGAVTEFYSDERQVEKIDGVDTRIGWKCIYEDYKEYQGIKVVSKVQSIKIFPDHELVYFASDNFSIQYL